MSGVARLEERIEKSPVGFIGIQGTTLFNFFSIRGIFVMTSLVHKCKHTFHWHFCNLRQGK